MIFINICTIPNSTSWYMAIWSFLLSPNLIQLGKRPTQKSAAKRPVVNQVSNTSTFEIVSTTKELDPGDIEGKVCVSDYVAMKIERYRQELPQIGKVKEINSSTVTVEWLIGSYSGIFMFWKERGVIICDSSRRYQFHKTDCFNALA